MKFFSSFLIKYDLKTDFKTLRNNLKNITILKLNSIGTELIYHININNENIILRFSKNHLVYEFYYDLFDDNYYIINFLRLTLLLSYLKDLCNVYFESVYDYLIYVLDIKISYAKFNDVDLNAKYDNLNIYLQNLSDINSSISNKLIEINKTNYDLNEELNLFKDFSNKVISKLTDKKNPDELNHLSGILYQTFYVKPDLTKNIYLRLKER